MRALKRLMPAGPCCLWALFLITLSSLRVSAEGLHQFAMFYTAVMTADECALVERRGSPEETTRTYPGNLAADGCVVTIARAEFEQQFSFCYFAGINLLRAREMEMIECTVQQRAGAHVFSATAGTPATTGSQVMCYFTCVDGTNR